MNSMRFEQFLIFVLLISCNPKTPDKIEANQIPNDSVISYTAKNKNMIYQEKLESTKKFYPFDNWRESFSEGLEQYTQENCNKAQAIFDTLIAKLIAAEGANENDKVELFKTSVLSLNKLNDEIEGLIETGEREDLCELIDQITIAAELNPNNYADGEGLADKWRDW